MCAQKNGKDLPLALTLAILQMHCMLQMTKLALTLALTLSLFCGLLCLVVPLFSQNSKRWAFFALAVFLWVGEQTARWGVK